MPDGGRRPAGAGHRARLRAHRPARRRPDRRPVPRRQRDARWPGSGAPTGSTRPRFDWHGPATTTGSTWSAPAWTPSPRVTLNGVEVGRTANMHRALPLRRARTLLRAGRQHARGPLRLARTRYAEAQRDRLGDRPNAYPEPFNFIRKMACNFGWDWGPTLVTAGIWQPIGLHAWSTARLGRGPSAGRPSTAATGRVERARRASSGPADEPLTVAADGRRRHGRGGRRRPGSARAVLTLDRAGPARCGGRAGTATSRCYPLDVTLRDADGARAGHAGTRRIGFRTVRAGHHARRARHRRSPCVVNDVPVFVRGVNWIPDDAFPTRVTRDRLAERFAPGRRRERQPAAGLGRRPVRVRGLLRPRRRAGPAGLAGLPVRLRRLPGGGAVRAPRWRPRRASRWSGWPPHPSLVLWTGNNENIWGCARLGLAGAARRAHLGRAATTSTCCPRSSAELDPTRPYWPGSPYSGSAGHAPQRPGARHHAHLGRVEHRRLHAATATTCRASSPSSATRPRRRTRRCAARCRDEPLAPDSPGMRAPPEGRPTATPSSQRGLDAHLPRAARLRRLALPDPAQPGPGDPARRRALPVATGRLHGHDRLAAQRLLAGDLLGGGRRRRPPQAAVVRAAPRLRRPAAHRPAPRRRAWPWSRSTTPPTPWRAERDGDPADASTGEPRAKTTVELDVAGVRVGRRWRCRRTLARPDEPGAELLVAEAGDRRERACGSSPRTGTSH